MLIEMKSSKEQKLEIYGFLPPATMQTKTWNNPTIFREIVLKTLVDLIACGEEHLIFTTKTTSMNSSTLLFGLGSNKFGQCGHDPKQTKLFEQPILIEIKSNEEEKINIKMISCGSDHNLILMENGNVFSFGNEAYGKLGRNTTTSQIVMNSTNTKCVVDGNSCDAWKCCLISAFKTIVARKIAAGVSHSLILDVNGHCWSFGLGLYNQLGLFDGKENKSIPCKIKSLEEIKIVDISCGNWHSAFVSDRGRLFMCGWHSECGALGEDQFSCEEPVVVKKFLQEKVVQVECGFRHTVIRTMPNNEIHVIGRQEQREKSLKEYFLHNDFSKTDNDVLVNDFCCVYNSTFLFSAIKQ